MGGEGPERWRNERERKGSHGRWRRRSETKRRCRARELGGVGALGQMYGSPFSFA